MMEDAELQQLEATIATLETEIAGLTQTHEECIARAREFNARGREAVGKRTSLQAMLDKSKREARQELEARSIAAKQKANAEAAARAEVAKKAAEEAAAKKAAEPPQPTELELLRMEVAALRDELRK